MLTEESILLSGWGIKNRSSMHTHLVSIYFVLVPIVWDERLSWWGFENPTCVSRQLYISLSRTHVRIVSSCPTHRTTRTQTLHPKIQYSRIIWRTSYTIHNPQVTQLSQSLSLARARAHCAQLPDTSKYSNPDTGLFGLQRGLGCSPRQVDPTTRRPKSTAWGA
jgi:hypothetical protein